VKRSAVFLFGLGVVVCVGLADTPAQTPAPASTIKPAHFKHSDHAGYGVDTTDAAKCKSCHTIDAKGNVLAPAAQGHAPCLQAGCHADTFLMISEKNQAKAQKDKAFAEQFTKASAFCLACHEQVPWAWKKPTTRVLQGWLNQREHHIEMAKSSLSNMDHWAHTQAKKKDGTQVGCRDCHAVGADFKLLKGSPGHTQCAECHSPTSGVAFGMSECGRCHKEGSRDEFLRKVLAERGKELKDKDVASRPDADVRACDSAGEDAYKKKGRKVPCFRHETKEHREDAKGGGVQCKQCHWIVVDKARWGDKRSYSSLADLHLNKIIGDKPNDSRSMQHEACAGCHPHTSQVKLRGGNCQYCHVERTVPEPYW
jgi:hypothetical protein